jgi:DNA repair protein RecO (recombination protein O)
MPTVTTPAVVLHSLNYLETSRIFRLATRELGVQSVLARGARRSKQRFGSALDLFASGVAEIQLRPGRDLQTLVSFDVMRARTQLARDLDRFTAASALSELMLRFAQDETQPALYDALITALDEIGEAHEGAARDATLAGAWRLIAELGFGPVIDHCAHCHTALELAASAAFSHPAGGALCSRCAGLAPPGRVLPPDARAALRTWLAGGQQRLTSDRERKAHVRLLREFLHEHLTDGRPMRAFDVWERLIVPDPAEPAPLANPAHSLDAHA